jgi:putative ABC transport system permease protein
MMLLIDLKIAFRNLVNNKTYSLINVAGLALGMAVSFLIMLFVMHELSYDRFHRNHQRIFRVVKKGEIGGEQLQFAAFPAEFGPSLKAANAYIEEYVRCMQAHGSMVVKNPERSGQMFYEEHIMYADPSILRVFSFKLSKGNPHKVLSRPNDVVLSQRMVKKYFGNQDPMGKTLWFEGGHILQVVGIAENPPSNSSFNFDFLLSVEAFPILYGLDKAKWAAGGNLNTFLLLSSEKHATYVEKELNKTVKQKGFENDIAYSLENLAEIHLNNNFKNTQSTKLIYLFAAIAVLILSLALFNYMSLTTARATVRAKEVGVRKVVGSGRMALVKQFYTESLLTCFLAFLSGAVVVELLRQPFYNLLDLRIDASFLISPSFLAFLAALFFLTVVTAGSYPALILSGFAPIEVLKGRFAGKQKGVLTRKMFIIFQFTVSIALIVCSLIAREQVAYMQNKKLGLHKDQVVTIPLTGDHTQSMFAFRNEIGAQAGVQSVSVASNGLFRGYNIWFIKNPLNGKEVSLNYIVTDTHFVKTLGIDWKIAPVPGTFRSKKHVFLNETAINAFDISKKPLGKSISELDEVAGVLANFHFASPRDGIKPMALMVESDTASFDKAAGSRGTLYARLDPWANVSEKVRLMGQAFAKYYPGRPFEYYFLDEAFNKTFKAETRLSEMLSIFTGVAIFIACIALFGLVTFTAEARTKEIGIRKVLGASVQGIVTLISKDFVKLILISIVIAFPPAWYCMNEWLQGFSYRITIPMWIYLASGALAMIIAFATVSFQSIKAALMNPVKSLRSE